MDPCLVAAGSKSANATTDEIENLRKSSIALLLHPAEAGGKPARSLEEFRKSVESLGITGAEQHIATLWRTAKSQYEALQKSDPAKYPDKLIASPEDHMPDYKAYESAGDLGRDRLATAQAMAKDGTLHMVRGVKAGEESKPNQETIDRAVRVLTGDNRPISPLEFQATLGLTPSEAVAAVEVQASILRKNAIDAWSKAKSLEGVKDGLLAQEADPNNPKSEAYGQAHAEWLAAEQYAGLAKATMHAQEAIALGNSTEIGRSLAILKEMKRLSSIGGPVLDEHIRLFGDDSPKLPTDPGMGTDITRAGNEGGKSPEQIARDAVDEVLGKGKDVADKKISPQKGESSLVDSMATEGLIKRLIEVYLPSDAPKRDAKIGDILGEIGLKIKAVNKSETFHEWVKAITKETGIRLDPKDLFDAYQSLRMRSFKKVRRQADLKALAIKHTKSGIDAQYQDEAMKAIKAVDPNAPDANAQYVSILADYQRRAPLSWWLELPNLKRAIMTGWDMSAPGRQAATLTLAWGLNPAAFAARAGFIDGPSGRRAIAMQDAVKRRLIDMAASKSDTYLNWMKQQGFTTEYLKSEDYATRVMHDISNDDPVAFDEWIQSGGEFTKIGIHATDLAQREESHMSLLVDRWRDGQSPLLKFLADGIAGSERAYAVYLNGMRYSAFKIMRENYLAEGKTQAIDPELYRATAMYINDMTGRSAIPFDPNNSSARILGATFFSARHQLSRLKILSALPRAIASEISDQVSKATGKGKSKTEEYLNEKIMHSGLSLTNMPKELRTQVYGDTARHLSAFATLAGLAYFAGAEIDMDPRSSDFGTFKFGNTRLNFLGGLSGWINFLARFATGQSVNKKTRMTVPAGGNEGNRRLVDNIIQSKLAPVPGDILNYTFGKNVVGQSVVPSMRRPIPRNEKEWKMAAAKAPILGVYGNLPMHIKDTIDATTNAKGGWDSVDGALHGLLSLISYFGIGATSYDQNDEVEKVDDPKPARQKALPILRR